MCGCVRVRVGSGHAKAASATRDGEAYLAQADDADGLSVQIEAEQALWRPPLRAVTVKRR